MAAEFPGRVARQGYLACRLPGRRIRRVPRRMATRNTTMPMISRYSRPFATTPTMPSTIAAIISSRKRAIIRFSAQSDGSAAGQPPLTATAWLVGQAVVLEDRLFVARGQLAVGADRRGILHLLLVVADLEVPRAHGRLVKRDEHEPVPGGHSDLDRAERWQVGAGVDVDGFQLADLVALMVDHVVAAPFPDVGSLEHASLLSTAPRGFADHPTRLGAVGILSPMGVKPCFHVSGSAAASPALQSSPEERP